VVDVDRGILRRLARVGVYRLFCNFEGDLTAASRTSIARRVRGDGAAPSWAGCSA
jgi:hypothetical protein